MKIHVWVPEYTSEVGGIQTFSRFLVRGLRAGFPDAVISVFAKNDTTYPTARDSAYDKFFPFGVWPLSLRTQAFAMALFFGALRDRPEIIFVGHANFAPVAAALLKFLTTKVMAIGYGIEVWKISHGGVRRALRKVNGLLAISVCTEDRMAAALNIHKDRIDLFPCTFDSEKFYPTPKPHFLLKRYGLRQNQPVILTVARLAYEERYKGYDQILRALPEVMKAVPDVRYVLGGRGPDRPRVVALIKELKLEETVILAGYVPNHDLCAHYNLCDVFAMPSKGEGFGIVFLEAMACGKPVIAGNKDGSVDAVLDGKLGALIDPDDVNEIAETIIQIIEKRHPLKILLQPEELRRQVIKRYGYERFKERLRYIVEALLEQK